MMFLLPRPRRELASVLAPPTRRAARRARGVFCFSFSRERRRSRRLASSSTASPHTPPPARLLDLPSELLERVLSRCDSPLEIARVAAVSLLFHASLAEEGIRLWAQLEGRLSSCGKAESWQPGLLGHGEGVTRLNTPTRLPSPLGGERAVSVAAGAYHSLALTSSSVWSWGDGLYGRLGHGDYAAQWQPKKIEAFAGQRVVAVSAGGEHSLALSADGAVWSWGWGGFGRLGHGDDEQRQPLPKKVEALIGQRVVAVSAGGLHSFAITADGAVWSWGCGLHGQLGHGDQQNQLLPKKIEAFADQRVVAVSAGAYHSLALTADGAVWSWGWGDDGDTRFGKLGHGDQQNQLLPKKVEALAGQRVVAVSAGGDHSLALAANGAVWSCGDGAFGQLGHGDEQRQLQPKKVEAFAGRRVLAVSASIGGHSLALMADGDDFFAWGEGEHGCLGYGEDLSNQLLPKKIEAWAPAQE